MALVNCPECGKENVSDKAEMCPSCGYSIKNDIEGTFQNEKKIKISNNKNIAVIICISTVVLLFVFILAFKLIKYNNGIKYYENQEWNMAIKNFEEAGNFSDSEELLEKAKLELVSDNYELGLYAYSTGDFDTSVNLLKEAESFCPTYPGLEEQLNLSEFMNELQGTWICTKIYIEVHGFKARVKEYNSTTYSDYCDIKPYKDSEGYYTILVRGKPGERTWRLKCKEGTSDPEDELGTDWVGYASNMDGTGVFFKKGY